MRRLIAASGVLLLTLAAALLAQTASQVPSERVRVPSSHANVHTGPSSTTEVLVLVPRGTVLAVVGRDREWIQVRLTPELRKTGMVMRWYKNEDRGWMHDSTVEVVATAGQSRVRRFERSKFDGSRFEVRTIEP